MKSQVSRFEKPGFIHVIARRVYYDEAIAKLDCKIASSLCGSQHLYRKQVQV
jgi:hypothetical protein